MEGPAGGFPWVRHLTNRHPHVTDQGGLYPGVGDVIDPQGHPALPRLRQLLPAIYKKLLNQRRPVDELHQEKQERMAMDLQNAGIIRHPEDGILDGPRLGPL